MFRRIFLAAASLQGTIRDASLLLRIIGPSFRDASLLLRIKVEKYVDASLLMRVMLESYTDASLLMRLVGAAYQDASLLLRIMARSFADASLLMRILGPSYADASLLMRIDMAARDASLLMRMAGQAFADAALLLRVQVGKYRDATLLMRVFVSAYRDVSILLRLAIQRFADAALLLRVQVLPSFFKDASLLMGVQINTQATQGASVLAGDVGAPVAGTSEVWTVTGTPAGNTTTPFLAAIGQELVLVTAIAGNSWTVTRGVAGYSAVGTAGGPPGTPIAGSTTVSPHYAGAELTIRPHTIIASRGGLVWDFTATAIANVHTRALCPGGESDATWELYTYQPSLWLADADARVIFRDSEGRPYWSGIIERPAMRRLDDGSHHLTFRASGFVSTMGGDPYDTDVVFDAYTAVHTIVERVRDEKCPQIHYSNQYIVHGGQSVPTEYHAIDKSPLQIVNDLCAMGDSGIPLDFCVFTDTDGEPKIELRKRDTQKVVKIPWATLQDVPLAWESGERLTKVIVRWSGGQVIKTAAGAPVRARTVDLANSVDSLATAEYIAQTILAASNTLTAIGEGDLLVEYPKPIYDEFDNELSMFDVRPGWLVRLPGVTAPNSNLPIADMQIKAIDIDHSTMTLRLTLGKWLEYERWVLRIGSAEKRRLDSELHEPISGIPVAPPESLPTGVDTGLAAQGTGGRIGYDAVAEDADISTTWVSLDGGGDVIATGRKPDIIVENRIRILKLKLRATGLDQAEGTVKITLGHGTGAAVGGEPAIASIALPFGYEAEKELSEDPNADEHVTTIEPGQYISVVVEDDPFPTAVIASLAIMVQKLEGSARPTSSPAPIIQGISAVRDAENVTTFTITTNRPCRAQIEFGIDTGYRCLSRVSEVLAHNPVVTVRGLPVDTHYRVHVKDLNGIETISGDQVVA